MKYLFLILIVFVLGCSTFYIEALELIKELYEADIKSLENRDN